LIEGENKNAYALIKLIREHVLPGSIILTDI